MTQRNESVEILRIVMMLFIVMLHVCGRMLSPEPKDVGVALCYVARSVFFLGVPTFAFITGYYGISWNEKKFWSFETMAITYGVIVSFTVLLLGGGSASLILRNLFPIASGICWYFSAYMMLMLFSKFFPVMKSDKVLVDKKIFLFLMLVVCGAGFLFKLDGTNFLYLVSVYMIGRFVRHNPITIIKDNPVLFFLLFSLVNGFLFLGAVYFNVFNGLLLEMLSNNHNPLLLLAAISLFYCFESRCFHTSKQILTRFASYMFAIYVFHALLISQVFDKVIRDSQGNFCNFLLWVFILFCGTFFAECFRRRIIKMLEAVYNRKKENA